jgi:hypothetical protein
MSLTHSNTLPRGSLPASPAVESRHRAGTIIRFRALYERRMASTNLHTDVLAYAAKIMAAVENHEGIRCGWLEDTGRPCGEPATYLAAGGDLVASDTPVDAGGDVKSGPQWSSIC